jgi:hypothetical protein
MLLRSSVVLGSLLLSVGFATPSFADSRVLSLQKIKSLETVRIPPGETSLRVFVPAKMRIDRAMTEAGVSARTVVKTNRRETKEVTLAPGRYTAGENRLIRFMRPFTVVQ